MQLYIFLVFIIVGMLTALIYDLFRILRKVFKTKDFITQVEDMIFWLITRINFIN